MNLDHMNVPMALKKHTNEKPVQYENKPVYQPMMPMRTPVVANQDLESYCKMIDVLMRLKGKKADVLVTGFNEFYKDLTINKVDYGVLYATTPAGDTAIIPVNTITTVIVADKEM